MGLFNFFKKKTAKEQTAGTNKHWSEDLSKGLYEDPSDPSKKIYDWRLHERWEDYPVPNYDAVHTYCSVSIDGFDRTFYYRTRNPELQIGDEVYVPFGKDYGKVKGRIVDMEEFYGDKVPYPLSKTKYINGKVED